MGSDKLPDEVLKLIHSKIEKRPSSKDSNFNYIHQEDAFAIAELAFKMGRDSVWEELGGS